MLMGIFHTFRHNRQVEVMPNTDNRFDQRIDATIAGEPVNEAFTILTSVTGRYARLARLEKPVPKSSIETPPPHRTNLPDPRKHLVRQIHHGAFRNFNGQDIAGQLIFIQQVGDITG